MSQDGDDAAEEVDVDDDDGHNWSSKKDDALSVHIHPAELVLVMIPV